MDEAHDPKRSRREVACILGLDEDERMYHPAWNGLPLLAKSTRTENGLSGVYDGKPAAILHLATKPLSTSEEYSDEDWTIIVFEQLELPTFDCLPSTCPVSDRAWRPRLAFTQTGQNKETRQIVAKFGIRYQIRPLHSTDVDSLPSDEDQLRNLFRGPLLAALADRPGWWIQSVGNCLLLARMGSVPMEQWSAIWQEAATLRQAFLTQAPAGEPILPCPPGKELGRQYERHRGAMVGASAGSVLGFFGGLILVDAMSELVPDNHAAERISDSRLLVALFGGAALGALLCGVLGAWWPSFTYKLGTRWRPVSQGPPLLMIAAVAGFGLLGAGIGSALGLASVALLHQMLKPWMVPILFFSPFVVGQILGGLAGYRLVSGARSKKQTANGAQRRSASRPNI